MGVEVGYWQSEAGVIPDDWDVTQVGAEFHIQLGKMLDAEKNVGTARPFLGNRSIQWGRIDVTDLGTIKLTPSDLQRFRLREGDLLVCEGGEVGRAAIWHQELEECYYQKALHRLRPKRCYNVVLMLNILRRYASTGFLRDYVTQTSIAHLPKDKFEILPIPLPGRIEQDAIAEALSDADSLIASLEQLLAKKRQIMQGATQELLIPKSGWIELRLGDIAQIRDGTHQTPHYVEAGVPFYSVENVTTDNFINTKFISRAEHCLLTRFYKIEKGDILMTRIGSIGVCRLIDWDVDASFYVSLALLKIARGYSAPFVLHYSRTDAFQREIELNSLQSAIPRKINLGPISNLRIRMPRELGDQDTIAAILNDMNAEIKALEAKLAKARQIKQGMMQELLTGRIRLV